MNIKFLRVVSQPDRSPSEKQVIAIVDAEFLVKLSIRDGWSCDCTIDGDQCDHVDAVEDLLDDRVARHGWGDE